MPARLEKLGITFPYIVGPMVGISHVAFRELVRSYLPPSVNALIFTEMLSSRRIPNERIELCPALKTMPGEPYFVPQLLGNEEKFVAPSIKKLLEFSPWGIDINMGCPMAKTLKHNWGVRLMGDKKYAAEVVRFTKQHSTVPVSVKMRAGLDKKADFNYLDEFTQAIEEAGADWITIHCRTKEQGRTGEPNWEVVEQISSRRQIPVVLNGDIQTAEDAIKVSQFTDGAMFGRAATARPWILWQIAYKLGLLDDQAPPPPLTPEEEGAEYFRALFRFATLLEEHFGDTSETHRSFEYIVRFGHQWLPFGHEVMRTFKVTSSLAQVKQVITRWADEPPQRMSRRIAL